MKISSLVLALIIPMLGMAISLTGLFNLSFGASMTGLFITMSSISLHEYFIHEQEIISWFQDLIS